MPPRKKITPHPENEVEQNLPPWLRDTLITRAEKRLSDVSCDGLIDDRNAFFLVAGNDKLNDSFPQYEVNQENGYWFCSCQSHSHGSSRAQCSHIAACILYLSSPPANRIPQDEWDRRIRTEGLDNFRPDGREQAAVAEPTGKPIPWEDWMNPENLLAHEGIELNAQEIELNSPCQADNGQKNSEPELFLKMEHGELKRPLTIAELENLLPSWATGGFRQGQIFALEQIKAAYLNGKRNFLLEAPPGMGKTLTAYMVGKMLNCRTNYVCTTKPLQFQAKGDFVEAELLQGRRNYKTADYPHSFPKTSCGDCNFKTLTGCTYCIPKRGVDGEVLGFTSKLKCPYYIQKKKTQRADFSILNTAYCLTVFSNLMAAGRDNVRGFFGFDQVESNTGEPVADSYGFSERGLSIWDEADELEDAIKNHIEVCIKQKVIDFFDIHDKVPEKNSRWPKRIEFLELLVDKITAHEKRLQEDLFSTSEDNDADLDGAGDSKTKFLKSLLELREKIHFVLDDMKEIPSDERREQWVFEHERDDVKFKPVRIAKFANAALFCHSDLNIIMSGTIVAPEQFAQDLGLDWNETEFITMGSEIPPANRPIYFWPKGNMSFKTKDQDTPKILNAISEIREQFSGRMLVHTVSYELSRNLFSFLARMGYDVFTYAYAHEREGALKNLDAHPDGILLAPSMERGIDRKGDSGRLNVIPKVPYPNMKDRVISRRMFQPTPREGELWYKLQTIRNIIQAYGRTNRGKMSQFDPMQNLTGFDWSRTFILDESFKRLWAEVRSMVPDWFKAAFRTDTKNTLAHIPEANLLPKIRTKAEREQEEIDFENQLANIKF